MSFLLTVILLLLNISNMLLHSIGMYALVSLYRSSPHKPQFLYLINLSACESLFNFLAVFRGIPRLIPLSSNYWIYMDKISYYVSIVSFTGVFIVLQLNMTYITLDRLAKIVLKLRYTWYWGHTKTKYLLIITWCVGLMLCLSVSTIVACNRFDWKAPFFNYIFPTMEFSFIGIAGVTCIYIFVEINRKRKNKVSMGVMEIKIIKRLFLVPSLIILSFILLVIIPDLVYHFVVVINKNQSEDLKVVCGISYTINSLTSVTLYMCLLPDVRKFIYFTFKMNKLINIRNYTMKYTRLRTQSSVAYILPNLYLDQIVQSPPINKRIKTGNKVVMMISQV